MPDRESDHDHEHEAGTSRKFRPRGHGRREEDDDSLTLKQIWGGISHLNRLLVILGAAWAVWQAALAWIGYRAGTSPAAQLNELRSTIKYGDSLAIVRSGIVNQRIDTINTRFDQVTTEIRAVRYELCLSKQSADVCTRKIFLDEAVSGR
jgi:hypothetical protein